MTPPGAARLVALTAVVVALAAAVGITGGEHGAVERPLIAPGLVVADVTTVTLVPATGPAITIGLDEAGARVTAPVPGPADEAAVRDLISAVATARADRVERGAAAWRRAGLDAPSMVVGFGRPGAPPIEVRRGAALPASGQVWLGIGGRALLTPGWVGDALGRDLLALRRRRPFPPGPTTGVEVHGGGAEVVLAGDPLRRRDDGTSVRIAATALAGLQTALAAIVVDVLVTGDLLAPQVTVRVLGGAAVAELTTYGPCPGVVDHVLVDGSAGVGCVPVTSIDALVDAARTLAGRGAVLAAPLEGELVSVAEGDTVLARRGAGWQLVIGGVTTVADDGAVHELLAALATPGTPAPVPLGAADQTWTVTLARGAVETWRWWWPMGTTAAVMRRDDEPDALIVSTAAGTAVRGLGVGLRDLTVLSIDATTIAAIGARGAAPAELARGTLVGEWQVTMPPGSVAGPAVVAMVEALALVRGTAWLAATGLGRVRRTLAITLDAPPVLGATPSTHTISIGAARPAGACAVRVDVLPPLELPAATCAALLAPLTRRP